MIYCPECGTANRDGSKFCNECGHTLLAQTGVKCPQCDTLNAVQSVFCSSCGGRLLAQPTPAPSAITPPIKGLSLPTKTTVGEDEEDVEQLPTEGPEVPLVSAMESPVRSTRAEGAGELIGEESEEIPDWLRDLQASLPVEPELEAPEPQFTLRPPPPTPEAEVERASELDLQEEIEQSPETPPAVLEEAPQVEAGKVPDWLAELRSQASIAEPEKPAMPPVPLAEEELPSWLAELKASSEAEVPTAPPMEAELEEEELPSWMAELKASSEAEIPTALPMEAGLEEEELPSWLAALKVSSEAEVPAAPPIEAELEEGELPPWLAELKADRETLPSISEEGPKAEEGAPSVQHEKAPPGRQGHAAPEVIGPEPMPRAAEEVSKGQEMPDWLVPTPGMGIPGEGETLARAEIPAWLLALKPRELEAEGDAVEPVVEKAVEQTGVLAGIRDVLPVEMLIAQPRAATPVEVTASPFSAEADLVEAPRARLFAEIVSRSPVVAPKVVAKPRARWLDLLPWWIVYALLILAVAVPLLLGEPLFNRSIEPAPSVEALYEAIESLPGNAQVLVAVDYDPTTNGEMDIVGQSLVSHLMDRQARIAVVSLLPAGPATAENLVEEVAADHPDYQTGDGQRYVNLGYLPGQAAAVRLMGQSLPYAFPRDFEGRQVTDLAALSGITSTQSFDLIVELAAATDTLRWWIEQAAAPYGIPMVAGGSAAVDPMARTYYETDPQQLTGLIAGVPGAASYDSLDSGGTGLEPEMAIRLDSLLAGQVLVILVILGGTIAVGSRIRPKSVPRRGAGREQ